MRIFLFFFVAATAFAADNWKYAKGGDEVTAYTRSVSDSGFKEYKVETEVDATLSGRVRRLREELGVSPGDTTPAPQGPIASR